MADNKNNLPEGTDSVIDSSGARSGGGYGSQGSTGAGGGGAGTGRSVSGSTGDLAGGTGAGLGSGSTGSGPSKGLVDATGGDMAGIGVSGSSGSKISGSTSGSGSDDSDEDGGSSGSSGGVRGIVSNVSTKAKDEVTNRARGFVGDGLKSGSTTLTNISTLIGETVEQIEEKLGPQYAGYARTASESIQRYAQTLDDKDPEELVDDARDLVRKSPGVALAAAAVLGFGMIRLLKAGMSEDDGRTIRDGENRRPGKNA